MNKDDFNISVKINFKVFYMLGIIGLIVLGGGLYSIFISNNQMIDGMGDVSELLIKPVSAAEIYPHFVCTCCGKPLDKNNICCGIAEDMITYIDTQVEEGMSEDEVMLSAVKKYGLKSLAQESEKEEIKKLLAVNAPEERSEIILSPLNYDFGDVSQALGIVSESFAIRNSGNTDLVINNLLSSCGCTSAAIVNNGQEGPRFGMHNNPTDWSTTINPGASAELIVYYDPNVHPEFRGAATREVTVFSNDPVNFEKSVKIKLNQID